MSSSAVGTIDFFRSLSNSYVSPYFHSFSMATSLLQQLRSLVVVDVDSMDPQVAHRHTTADQKFQDMTSNQALAYNAATHLDNAELVRQAIKYVHDKNLDQGPDTFKMDVIDTLVRESNHLTQQVNY